MATINIEPTTASFTATGGQGTITLTDTASASWHDTPQSGDNWAAIREKEEGTWSDWFVFSKNGGGVSGDYLPLAGGDMTGAVRMTVGSNTTYLKSYALGHASGSSYTYDGYLTANSNGAAWLYGRTELNLVAGYSSSSQGKLTVTASDVTFNGTSILGGNISEATTGNLGGFKLLVNKRTGSAAVSDSMITTGSDKSGQYYGIEMNATGHLYVNVPWSSGTGGSTVSWGTVSGNTVQLTVDNQTKTLLLSTYSPDLSGYVTITGTQTISGAKTFSATNLTAKNILPSSSGYNLGSSSKYWGKIYLGKNGNDDVYIEYDSTNKCVRVYGAGIATDSYISAGGVQST